MSAAARPLSSPSASSGAKPSGLTAPASAAASAHRAKPPTQEDTPCEPTTCSPRSPPNSSKTSRAATPEPGGCPGTPSPTPEHPRTSTAAATAASTPCGCQWSPPPTTGPPECGPPTAAGNATARRSAEANTPPRSCSGSRPDPATTTTPTTTSRAAPDCSPAPTPCSPPSRSTEPPTSSPAANAPHRDTPERLDAAEAYFAAVGAHVEHGGNRAFYRPATDEIHVPDLDRFDQAPNYYATLAHEHAHWTGHPSRLARDLTGRFGDDSYAAEELVAELAAAMWCAQHGISAVTRPDHAAYLAGWLRILRTDTRALVTASSKAQSAVDHLNTCAGHTAEPAEPNEEEAA